MEYSCWSVGESMTSYKSSWWHKVNKSGACKFLNCESLSSDESSQQHIVVSQLKSQEVYWQTSELKEISWELPHARSMLVNWESMSFNKSFLVKKVRGSIEEPMSSDESSWSQEVFGWLGSQCSDESSRWHNVCWSIRMQWAQIRTPDGRN